MKKIYKILIIILVLGIIGAGVGYYMYQKPVKNYAESKADFTIPATQLFTEFNSNQTDAIAKYVTSNKTIQVSGIFNDSKKNDDGTYTILLKMEGDDNFVTCTLSADESQKFNPAEFNGNKTITLKGQCSGIQELIGKEVIMIRCGLVK